MQEKKESFTAACDFELGQHHVKRISNYYLYLPDDDYQPRLVVYIPGFGDDASAYRKVFCQKICEQYRLVTMTVDYHGLLSRSQKKEDLYFEQVDEQLIGQLLTKHGVKLDGTESALVALEKLNSALEVKGVVENITATLLPKKKEYQNGGLMAALDILNAINDFQNKYKVENPDVILVGSSNGGFIANLVSKIAPNTISAVIDNSSWASLSLTYIVGRDLKTPESAHYFWSNLKVYYYVLSAWTMRPNLPNTFLSSHHAIRGFDDTQIKQMAKNGSICFYYFAHAIDDNIAPTQAKINMAKTMISEGFDVHMEVFDQGDIDGKLVKNLEHGMGMSMLTLFDRAWPMVSKKLTQSPNDFVLKSKICYEASGVAYGFDFNEKGVSPNLLMLVNE
ncbi:DUF2920 family protein [Thiomicrospira microaerophila]|uniref:DUF2920 family protein n=1 Tax=Thiomicrospira microaerophila TaxID=406020 RepID=UPI0005C9ECF0|nr:DUF2920 family protein [Thiomicrospira microaerophila]